MKWNDSFLLRAAFIGSLALGTTPALALFTCNGEDLSAVPVNKNVDFSTQIQPIFNAYCSGCHTGLAMNGGLSLNAGVAYGNLVGSPSANPAAAAAGLERVSPKNPESSFLFRKMNCTDLDPLSFGVRMPKGAPVPLLPGDQALVLDWILQGAPVAKDMDQIFEDGFGRGG